MKKGRRRGSRGPEAPGRAIFRAYILSLSGGYGLAMERDGVGWEPLVKDYAFRPRFLTPMVVWAWKAM